MKKIKEDNPQTLNESLDFLETLGEGDGLHIIPKTPFFEAISIILKASFDHKIDLESEIDYLYSILADHYWTITIDACNVFEKIIKVLKEKQ